ncbi:Formyltransferase [Hypoxylon crocopeplum]|nr:Formyltransferase [Hypoxylon crocopeplum]
MQHPLRQAVAATFRSRPWREVLAEPGAVPLHRGIMPPFRAPTRISAPPVGVCRRCRQTRSYSSTGSSTLDKQSIATAPYKEETPAKQKKKKTSEPLRILFCGSDHFSCASLEALHREHVQNPALVQSIDVVVRPGKRTGRGYKAIQHPPIRELAEKLGLPVHERDTFTGWDMPPHTNLIIAVSFGLFVPPRLLRASRFGGLNVHPSLLPDLRGPAPLQHALLAGRAATGVSLQTLDAQAFDRGVVLARTPPLPIPADVDYATLLQSVKSVAAELLVRGLRDGVHVPPLEEAEREENKGVGVGKEMELLHAPKITKRDRQVRAENMPYLWRRFRALGPLWFWTRDGRGVRKRVIIERMSSPALSPVSGEDEIVVAEDNNTDSLPLPWFVDIKDFDDASTLAISSSGGVDGPYTPYLVPFEEDDNPPGPDTDGDTIHHRGSSDSSTTEQHSKSNKARVNVTHLVLWFPAKQGAGTCFLGDCRVELVKVEGEKAKLARDALKDFLVPVKVGEDPSTS